MDHLAQDIRLALRGLRRSPTFSLTAILVLGLGIGMAVAIASVVDAVLLKRLPVRDQQQLVVLWTYHDPSVEQSIDDQTLQRVRQESRTMRDIAGVVHFGAVPIPWIEGDRTIELRRTQVTANFFDVLGAHPVLGRFFDVDDGRVGAAPVMVISFAFWQRHFGGDSAVIGRGLTDAFVRNSVRIVGVAPPGLNYPIGVDAWIPITDDELGIGVRALARLGPGATLAGARAEFFSLSQRIDPARPHVGATAISLTQAIVGDVRPALIALSVAVTLLVLIACVNVSSLLLLRVAARAREFAIRRALGAGSTGIVRLVVSESGVLAIAGGLLGFVLAQSLLRLFLAYAPARLPSEDVMGLAGIPPVAVTGITLIAFLAFGAAPAFVASTAGSETALRSGARSGSDTRRRVSVRQLLVASQIALALVMLAGAGLVVRSLRQLERVRLGFTPAHLSVVSLTLPAKRYEWAGPSMLALGEQVMSRWKALPGVEEVTPIALAPFYGANVITSALVMEGRARPAPGAEPWAPMEEGGPEYFRTLGIPLIRGRGFLASDREDAPPVAVVSEQIARRYWPGENPIGQRIRFWQHDSTAWRTVVGVAGDIRWRSIRDASPTVYLPWRQGFWQGGFALRTRGALGALLPSLRRSAREIDPQVDLWQTMTLDEELAGPLAQPRLNAYLLSGFGLTALLLAAIGLYGAMASSVRERTREIGVKMALGASQERVRREVLWQAVRTFGVGTLVGLAGALLASRLLTSILYDVSPADPIALAGACAALLVVALGAAYIPARRATRVDPVQALRVE